MVFGRKQMVTVSVLMCVYKREKFLAEAIESILNQTYKDFEFVIVLDGKTEKTLEILNIFVNKDSRVTVLVNDQNTGITKATTRGLMHCKGKYIALMDSDDICLPDRFQKQLDFLEDHPEIDALATGFDFMDEEGNKTGKFLVRHSDSMVIRFEMFYHCMLHNPTVMARTSYFRKFNEDQMEESLDSAQDYAFWLRTNFNHLFSNLPDRLLLYRLHTSQISNTAFTQQRKNILISAHIAFEKLLGKPIAKEVVRGFYFSKRLTITDARVIRKGLQVMFQVQKAFERTNELTRDQKKETRTFSYEKIKSYAIKYKKMPGVLLIGMIYLLRLMPAKLVIDILNKMKKLDGYKDLSEEMDELEIL